MIRRHKSGGMEYISLSWPKNGLIINYYAVISSLLTSAGVRAAAAAIQRIPP
jgi:hypothetical protein